MSTSEKPDQMFMAFGAVEEQATAVTPTAKAYFAWHDPPSEHAHLFMAKDADAPCQRCGRTRKSVRWDDLPAGCTPKETTADAQPPGAQPPTPII